MSTNWPAVSNRPSMSRRLRPLSITWVRPCLRGFPGRCGRSRKPSLKTGIDFLQSFLGALLHVVEDRVAVGVDADRQRPEVLDAEAPQALRHQLLPRDLFDLLDLRGLERRGAADDREVDHPVAAHRLDRLVGKAALAADRAHAVVAAERLREPDPAYVRRGVQEERAAQIHRRLLAVVEDADLRAVADPDDVSLDDDLVAGAQLQDLAWVRDRKGQLMLHLFRPRLRMCAKP